MYPAYKPRRERGKERKSCGIRKGRTYRGCANEMKETKGTKVAESEKETGGGRERGSKEIESTWEREEAGGRRTGYCMGHR